MRYGYEFGRMRKYAVVVYCKTVFKNLRERDDEIRGKRTFRIAGLLAATGTVYEAAS
jgi:hypothetical protein